MAYLQLLQTLVKEKQIVFKHLRTNQLYAQTKFHGKLRMTVNKRSDHFSSFGSGFEKIILRSDVELPRQAENDRVEQFRHKM